jgi:uncharacterized membrane protein
MKKINHYLKSTFLAGIFTALPIIITYFFLSFILKRISGFLIPYLEFLSEKFYFPLSETEKFLLSLSFLIIIIFFIGVFAKIYIGKKTIDFFEKLLSKIPIIRSIYSAIRQIIDAFQLSSGNSFKKVVLVEYPKSGVYSVGFVTKETSNYFNEKIKEKCSNVFIPTTPNPTSGFILIIPNKDIIELDLTVEEGAKFIISAGLLSPEKIKEELRKNVQ